MGDETVHWLTQRQRNQCANDQREKHLNHLKSGSAGWAAMVPAREHPGAAGRSMGRKGIAGYVATQFSANLSCAVCLSMVDLPHLQSERGLSIFFGKPQL